MRFGPVPVAAARGHILGHNVYGTDGRRLLRKGRTLEEKDVERLRQLGRSSVYVARLEAGDVDENTAAERVARAIVGGDLELSGPSTGRVNLHAAARGLVRVDVDALGRLHGCEGVTLATLPSHTAVDAGRVVGTLKILPYALAKDVVSAAEDIGHGDGPVLRVDAFQPRRAGLIVHASPAARERTVRGFERSLRARLEQLGSTLDEVAGVALEEESGVEVLARALTAQVEAGFDLIVLAGETAIQDRQDLAPRAVEQAGGEVICVGAPVDPGNLLMLAELAGVAVLGAPGCARSPKANIIDRVLPRLLAGDRLGRADVVAMAHGGLLEDVPERPLPRSRV